MHARAVAMTVLPCNLAYIPEQTNRACKHATATDGHWPLSRRSGILFMHNRLVLVSTQVATAGERLSPQRIFNFNQTKLRSRNFSRPRVSMCGYSTTVLLSTPRRLVTIGHPVAGMHCTPTPAPRSSSSFLCESPPASEFGCSRWRECLPSPGPVLLPTRRA
jgi:hypothetical protein